MANETMVSSSQPSNSPSKTSERSLKLKRIRDIKNSVIGNRFKKLQYLHVLPELHSVLSSSNDVELQVQAIAAIGSLAYGFEDGAKAVVKCDGISSLVHALAHNDQQVVVAAARSLKLVLQSPSAPREPVLQQPVLQRLIGLVKQPPRSQVNDIAAALLCLCCINEAQAQAIVSAGAVPALAQLLMSTKGSSQEAAVEALATLTQYSKDACQQLLLESACIATCNQQKPCLTAWSLEGKTCPQQPEQQLCPPVLRQLLHLTRQYTGRIRYFCVSCISNVGRNIRDQDQAVQVAEVCRCVVPYVARLLVAANSAAAASGSGQSVASVCAPGKDQSRYLYQVPLVLSALVNDRPELLKLAVELDTIQTLIKLLHSKAAAACPAPSEAEQTAVSTAATALVYKSAAAAAKAARVAAASAAATAAAEDAATLRRGCLTSLAALATQSDEARQKMMEGGRLMAVLVPCLSDSDISIRIAAASCLRGLSRSVKLLRGGFISDSVASPLVAMLQDTGSSDVQVAAAAALCNLVLGFSSVRPSLIKSGVIPALVPLFNSMDSELRMHAVWAYKNLAVECSSAAWSSLLSELTWQGFLELLTADDDMKVQQQAYGLLQNLLCSGGDSIDQVIRWGNGELLRILEEGLDSAKYKQLVSAKASSEDAAAQQLQTQLTCLLYAVNNVCSGTEAHKAAVMASRIPTLLLRYLRRSTTGSGRASDVAAAGCSIMHTGAVASICGLCLEVHLAAVWCVINLLWCDPPPAAATAANDASSTSAGQDGAAVAARAAALRQLGYEEALNDMLAYSRSTGSGQAAASVRPVGSADAGGALRDSASSQDLAERVQTALEKLKAR